MKASLTGLLAGLLSIFALTLSMRTSMAQSSTWNTGPSSGDWNTATNWTPANVPGADSSDTAIFANSSITNISLSGEISVAAITFTSGGGGFTISTGNRNLQIGGFGITNNSGNAQTFIAEPLFGTITFYNNATAGSGINLISRGVAQSPGPPPGLTQFLGTSTAGNANLTADGGLGDGGNGGLLAFVENSTAAQATVITKGGVVNGAQGGFAQFGDSATAGQGTFTNKAGAVSNALGGETAFFQTSTGGSATFTNEGGTVNNAFGGATIFSESSTAGNAILNSNGGTAGGTGGAVLFQNDASGGTCRVKVLGNGSLDISSHNAPGVTIGSIEGSGNVFVGPNNLTVGSNNLSTSFSGSFQDFGQGGALTKMGSGILTLEGKPTNDYIGDAVTLSIAGGSTVNLNFLGAPDRIRSLIVNGVPQTPGLYGSASSGAPNQLPQFAGAGKVLVFAFAVSRKTQGADTFDINLPFAGPPGVECRSGGATNDYQVVVSFANSVTFTSADVTSGNGAVTSTLGNNTTQVTINLTGITTAQRITVTLFDVDDGTNVGNLDIPMAVLVGDTSGNGLVNGTDVSQTKLQSGHPISSSNFREDITGNGTINGSDVASVKLQSGNGLP
jgi:hypothetical protein